MKNHRIRFIFLFLTAILQSCIKTADFNFNKLTTPIYNGEWAAPLVSSHITFRDILKNQEGLIQPDAQGNLVVSYSLKNLISQSADQLMKIPDQHLIQNASFSTGALGTGAIFNYSFTPDIPFTGASASQQFDSVYIKIGSFRIQINTNFNKNTTLNLKITSLIRRTTRQVVTIPQMTITPNATSTYVDVDVSDCILILKTIGSINNNMHFELRMALQGNTNSTFSSYSLTLDTQITNLKFASLYGKLGNFTMNLSNSLDIGLFSKNIGGAFQFGADAVDLRFNIDNSFGLPVQLKVKDFTAHSDANTPHDIAINLFGASIPNTINLDAPTTLGQTKTTSVVTTNSNIKDALSISPGRIIFNADAITNPGNIGNLNFVSDQSKINLNMDVLMKLFGGITNFVIQDTLDFNLANMDQIESLTFRVNTTNDFPLGVKLQVYFTDDVYRILDTMFSEPLDYIIKPAAIGPAPDYKVTVPIDYQFPDIVYNAARVVKIKSAKKIILKAALNSTNNSLVKIYDSNYIDVKLALKAKTKLQSN